MKQLLINAVGLILVIAAVFFYQVWYWHLRDYFSRFLVRKPKHIPKHLKKRRRRH